MFRPRVLDRYVLKEMLAPFAISIFAFTVLWVGRVIYDSMKLLIEMRPPISLVLRLVIYQFPWVLGMSLPLATLFAASLSVNRLTQDSEMTAVRMSGTPLRRIFLPILAVGIAASAVTLWLDESVTPRANREAQRTVLKIAGQQKVPPIRENVFFESEGYHFYVQKVRRSGNLARLENIMIYETPPPGEYPTIITARAAESRDNFWVLTDGVTHKLGADGLMRYEMAFPRMELNLARAVQYMWETEERPEEMNLFDLGKKIEVFSGAGGEVTKWKVDWHFKLSLPLSCLVFALCAAPLAHRFGRKGSYSGILLGIIIMFLYWNNILLGQYLGLGGIVPPAVAGWSQNVIFGLVGLYLIWREE
ncbi:MAG: LptF/LptG family permease [Armatimonadota bacterium]